MKKVPKLIFFLLTSNLFATTFFSGEGGLASSLINKSSSEIDPALRFTGFLGGQLALSNSLSIQGEFSLYTDDLFENGFSKETLSIFRIDELSGTFTKSFADATHTFTVFKGFNEPIGSQKFITRRLGVKKYTSILTENYLGQNGVNAYEVFGTGAAYSVTMRQVPLALGIDFNKNNENIEDVSQLNIDVRGAMTTRLFTLDFLAGLGAPLYTKNGDEDVFLLIDTLYYHTGIDLLLGNRYSTAALYVQCGLDYLPVRKSSKAKDFELSEQFILLEPRFKFGDAFLHITLFNVPTEKVLLSDKQTSRSFLLEDTFGVNFAMFAETIYKNHRNYSAGLHCQISFEDKHFTDFTDKDFSDSMNIKFCPFAELDADGGKVNMMLQANVMKFADKKEGAFKLHVGYKKEF